MFNIVLLGYTGSGKTTHATKLEHEFGFFHLDSGEIIRKLIRDNTDLGKKMKKYAAKGETVPDEMILDVLGKIIRDNQHKDGFIFDGFPRNKTQAEYLDDLLRDLNTQLHLVIHLITDKENAKRRILEKNRDRKEDLDITKKELLDKKIQQEEEQLNTLIEKYEKQNKLIEFDTAHESVRDLQNSIEDAIKSFQK